MVHGQTNLSIAHHMVLFRNNLFIKANKFMVWLCQLYILTMHKPRLVLALGYFSSLTSSPKYILVEYWLLKSYVVWESETENHFQSPRIEEVKFQSSDKCLVHFESISYICPLFTQLNLGSSLCNYSWYNLDFPEKRMKTVFSSSLIEFLK